MVQRQGTEQGQSRGHSRNVVGTVWDNIVGWVRQESAATTALIQAFIALGIAFEWWHWSPAQTGAVIGIVAALLGMFVRSQVTPIHRFRPSAEQRGASGRAMYARPQGEPGSGVRVLPGAGPDAGMAGGPPPGPDPGQATRPDLGPPGAPPTRPDVPPGGPDVPPGFPGPRHRQ